MDFQSTCTDKFIGTSTMRVIHPINNVQETNPEAPLPPTKNAQTLCLNNGQPSKFVVAKKKFRDSDIYSTIQVDWPKKCSLPLKEPHEHFNKAFETNTNKDPLDPKTYHEISRSL